MFNPLTKEEVEYCLRPLNSDFFSNSCKEYVKQELYLRSLQELSNEIKALNPSADIPHWQLNKSNNCLYKTHKGPVARAYRFSTHDDYLKEVEAIEKEFDYDKLVRNREAWDANVKERLKSLRRPRLLAEPIRKPA